MREAVRVAARAQRFRSIAGLCDRIAVMHRGALGRARPASEWTEVALLDEATRGAA